jgi:hypothetical protein
MVKIAQAFVALRSFRALLTTELPGQQPRQSTIEYVAPDKYHLISGTTEFISIGPDSYINM